MTDFIVHSDIWEFQSEKIWDIVRKAGSNIQKGLVYSPQQQAFIECNWWTVKDQASIMLLASWLSEPYWPYVEAYSGLIYNSTLSSDRELNKLKIPDSLYYGVQMDINKIQQLGCKSYIIIPKKVRRKNYKRRAELAIFVAFEDNTLLG